MVWALICLQFWCLQNRLRAQLRRLRQPKYLIGALAGSAYFYFFVIRGFVAGGFAGKADPANPLDFAALVETAGALGLAGLVISTWLFPEKRASLDFTEPEIAFLFPAPISRQALVHYRILRAQVPLLFGALIMMLFSGRFAQAGQMWTHLLGWWLMLAALELHRLGAAFARTRLMDRGIATWQRRTAVLAFIALAGTVFVLWARVVFVPLTAEEAEGGRPLVAYLQRTAGSGPWFWLLLPFRLLVRPMIAGSVGGFLTTLLPLLGTLAALYFWVLRSTVSFEEATLERARERARAIAAVRSGRWHLARPTRKRSAPFELLPTGPRLLALTWKNLISMGTAFTPRLWIGFAAMTIVALVVLKGFLPGSMGLQILGAVPLGLAPVLFIMGPQLLMMDLRQDLPMADTLKTYPLPGWQLVLGELLAPAVVLTLIQWLCVLVAVTAFSGFGKAATVPLFQRLAVGIAVAMVAPGLNLVSFLIHNAAVLLFPAWARLAPGQAHGFEAMGRGILLMVGQVVCLALTLALPAAAFATVFFVGRLWVPWPALLPGGALATLAVLLIEAYAGLRMLGDLFERLDVSAELIQVGA